jgi:GT2 family glycosyltransferase
MKTQDRIVVGWIDPGQVDGAFAANIARLYADRHSRIAALARVEGGMVARQRNELCALFLNTSHEWLLMMDSDEILSIAAFDLLVDTVHDRDRPIVSALVFGAYKGDLYPTPVPCIFRAAEEGEEGPFRPLDNYPPNTVIEVTSAGGGCLLIHRTVLEKVRDDVGLGDWSWFQDGPYGGKWLSEDHLFCMRVREAGFPIHAHTGAILPHRKRYWLDDRHHAHEGRRG